MDTIFIPVHQQLFPEVSSALDDPNGLLIAGGELSPVYLVNAYINGIFPWYSEEPILWWSPDPRMVIFPGQLHISHSLRKHLNKLPFSFSTDTVFTEILQHCSRPNDPNGQWLIPEMQQAYYQMHQLGFAHSIEVWQESKLVGGLYGLAIGGVFFAESMFSLTTNASKAALVLLQQQCLDLGYQVIDCQVESAHLISMGAVNIERPHFSDLLNNTIPKTNEGITCGPWAPLPDLKKALQHKHE